MRSETEIAMTDAATRSVGDVDAHRRVLVAAAYRMLGTVAEAEDAAQEAYVRWLRLSDAEREAIANPGGWLMRVTGRICLDVLGSARVRHETYVGEWLPEPVPASSETGDPADAVIGAESVSTALLLVLETLTPAERVAFVLHEVFAVPFAEIAEVLGRSAAACRQLAASARRHVGRRRGATVPRTRHDQVVAAFAAASATGSLEALVRVLAPDVVLVSDGGGVVSAARRPVRGADHVARFLLGLARKQPTAVYEPAVTGDGLGFAIRVDGVIAAAVAFATDGERVTDVWMMRNPHKLRAWV
ncbi:RNA polymerase sigma factor SigJ [Microbacterium oleivorans]|nr:RNA polymerase sigma factor SigJ [Microbacterium oleivorans]